MSVCYIDCSPFMRNLLSTALAARLPGLVVHDDPRSVDELVERLQGVTVALNGHTHMPAELLARCHGLRSIVFLGTGATSYIDVAAAEALGMVVRTVPGYGNRTVAEHAMALMLAAARRIAAMDSSVRRGEWETMEGMDLGGKRLGVIGTGGIGATFIRLAEAFGMDVVGWNRSAPREPLPGRMVPLDILLETSDVVSLHLALNPGTQGFLDTGRLARMKPSAILVNTARGALVDEAAMIDALQTGRLGHAALDVFAEEPLPAAHPLRRLPNVTLTAHAGFKTPEASRRLLAMAIDLATQDLAVFGAG